MEAMFYNYSSLESIDLSSFNTSNVIDMTLMFSNCSSLKKDNIILNNKDDKIIKQIERYCK